VPKHKGTEAERERERERKSIMRKRVRGAEEVPAKKDIRVLSPRRRRAVDC
jgi:hypothetical protein